MTIMGVLVFYDESVSWLATAVTGFARVCDAITAVDGAYALLPGARPASHPRQAEAILGAAEAAGVACTVHRPSKLFFGNEIEKRNYATKLAGANLVPDEDWLLVFDADCHVFRAEPEVVRWELEHTELDVATWTALDGEDFLADAELAEYVKREDYSTEWTSRTRDLYRWHPSLLYGPQHWMVSRMVRGRRRWIRHSCPETEPCLDLDAALVAYHRSRDRAYVRRITQQEYYRAREQLRIEEPSDSFPKGRVKT